MSNKSDIAGDLFLKGCNCSQAVLCAFCDEINFNEEVALKLASSFGGGMGKLREVCGAVSAMFMIAGIKYGYSDVNDVEAKEQHYKLIQELAESFTKENGSIICRELLELDKKTDSCVPAKRTKNYYESRPCLNLVESAAEIIENKIKEKNL